MPLTLPKSMQSFMAKPLPNCETWQEWSCMMGGMSWIFKQNIWNICPKHCINIEYSGKVSAVLYADNISYQSWELEFPTDEIEVYEEYLMYDMTGLIGSIGGTLGLFLGFSFRDVLSIVIEFFRHFTFFRNNRL